MNEEMKNGVRQFVEEFGVFFERLGFPRMAGRIWGWLLTCDPPHQTAEQIAKQLKASRGSVSTMTRLLIQIGLVERIGRPGVRSGFYRVREGGFAEVLRFKMRLTAELRAVVERGMELMKREPPATRRHLEEYRSLCLFLERDFPAMIEKWKREWQKR